MKERALLDRFMDVCARQHDTIIEMQSLGDEIVDHCARMRSMNERLQSSAKTTLDTPGVMSLPAAIRPVKKEAQG